MEFSVPASVQNLELSVPTHLVLAFLLELPVLLGKKKANGGIMFAFCKAESTLEKPSVRGTQLAKNFSQ